MMGFSIKLRPIVYAMEYSFSIDGLCVVQVFVIVCVSYAKCFVNWLLFELRKRVKRVWRGNIYFMKRISVLLLVGDEKEEPHRKRTTAAAVAQASTMTFLTIMRNSIFFSLS